MYIPKGFRICSIAIFIFCCVLCCTSQDEGWKPSTDWGHWRLGHRSNLEFLEKNQFTVTFGSGAPNFERATRAEFDAQMEEAKQFNQAYHDSGYIVLRYLSTSLGGRSETGTSAPKKDQITMLSFYNERWNEYEDYIGPKPPEDPTTWITVHPDGTFPHYRYAPYGRQTGRGFETWGCPNNPYYVRMMEGRMRAQAETGIDGSYVDWTQIAGGTCYCNYCRTNFIKYLEENLPKETAQKKYGMSDYANIKLPEKRGEKFWMEWIKFRGLTVAKFHDRLRSVARQYNPHFMIAGNVFGGFGFGPIAYDAAGNMDYLGKVDDFIYSEIQEFLDSAPRKNEAGMKITNSPALKFLAAASHGKPVVVYATEITPPIFPDPTEKCLSAMAQMNIAEAAANHAIFREKRETPPGATAIHNFLAANEQKLVGAHLHSNVAVLTSLNQYLADELSFAFSTSRVFADNGIAHVMIVEDDLTPKNLAQYELVVVPYLPLLGIDKQEALIRYVENGGTLVLVGECGKKDQYNVPNASIPLAKIFGKDSYASNMLQSNLKKGRAVYIPVEIPASKFLIKTKAKGEFTTFGPTMADVFADIPEGYTRGRINPQLHEKLEEVSEKINLLLNGNLSRVISDSPYIEMTTMLPKDKSHLLVHFVNYDVTVDGTITPARSMKAQVVLPKGKTAKSVVYNGELSDMRSLDFKTQKNDDVTTISFAPDVLSIYGLAIIELE